VTVVDSSGTLVLTPDGDFAGSSPDPIVAYSSNDMVAASVQPSARDVVLWRLPTLSQRATEHIGAAHGDLVTIALNRDASRLVALDTTGRVVVWNTRAHRLVRSWHINATSSQSAVAISNDGTKAAVWADDHKAWVLDSRSDQPPSSVTASLPALAFSADGTVLASAGPGVQLWDTATLEPIGDAVPVAVPAADPSTVAAPGAPVRFTNNVMQFSSDGRRLLALNATSGSAAEVRDVVIDSMRLAAAACETARRSLTPGEVARFHTGALSVCPPA
jgi:WD40 repeat protein